MSSGIFLVPGDLLLNHLHLTSTELKQRKLSRWEKSQYKAVINWLTRYQPSPSASNLDNVRGYLEACYHFFALEDWTAASTVLEVPLKTPTHELLHTQLKTWGYYAEQTELYERLLYKLGQDWDVICLNGLANSRTALGDYSAAIAFQKQHAEVAAQIPDPQSEAYAWGNIGLNHYYLGQYAEAIEQLTNSVATLETLQDYRGQQMFLGNLGLTY